MPTTTKPQVLLPGQHAAPDGPVDLMNMYVMHHAFRRDLINFRTAVEQTPPRERSGWQALHRRWTFFATTLHHHHAAEDAGLWPLMLDRVDAHGDEGAREVLEAMQAEHARIDPILDECAGGFAQLAEESSERVRGALQLSLEEAWRLLDGHLGHEERDAMAILQRYLTEADWQDMERDHFRPAYSPREIWTVVPWSQLGLPAEIRRRTLAAGGPLIALLWRLSRGPFARQEAATFGAERITRPQQNKEKS